MSHAILTSPKATTARHPGSHAARSGAWLSGIHSATLTSNGMDPGYAVRLSRPAFRDDGDIHRQPNTVIPGLVRERGERRVSGAHAVTLTSIGMDPGYADRLRRPAFRDDGRLVGLASGARREARTAA
jgi:hypothetical protein